MDVLVTDFHKLWVTKTNREVATHAWLSPFTSVGVLVFTWCLPTVARYPSG